MYVLIAALLTSLVPMPRPPSTKDVLTALCEQKDRNQGFEWFSEDGGGKRALAPSSGTGESWKQGGLKAVS